jgi:hypothetical protein
MNQIIKEYVERWCEKVLVIDEEDCRRKFGKMLFSQTDSLLPPPVNLEA